jgi:hypothetical protein
LIELGLDFVSALNSLTLYLYRQNLLIALGIFTSYSSIQSNNLFIYIYVVFHYITIFTHYSVFIKKYIHSFIFNFSLLYIIPLIKSLH